MSLITMVWTNLLFSLGFSSKTWWSRICGECLYVNVITRLPCQQNINLDYLQWSKALDSQYDQTKACLILSLDLWARWRLLTGFKVNKMTNVSLSLVWTKFVGHLRDVSNLVDLLPCPKLVWACMYYGISLCLNNEINYNPLFKLILQHHDKLTLEFG